MRRDYKMKSKILFWFVSILIFTECALLVESKKREAKKQWGHVRSARSPDTDKSLFGETLDGKADPNEFDGNIQSDDQNLRRKKRTTKLGYLPLPPGYNKLVIPLGNISKELFVRVYLSIREVLDVDYKNGVRSVLKVDLTTLSYQIIELDTELGISWIDWEIWKHFIQDKEAQEISGTGSEEWSLDAEFLKQIWKPDIFIDQMVSAEHTSIYQSKLINLRFLVRNDILPGSISFQSRQSFKVRCEMDFHYYPADVQKCPIHIRSYSYSQEQLFLMWNPRQKVFLDSIADTHYDFQVSGVEPGEKLYDLFTTSQAACCNPRNFSTLTFNLEIRRNFMYHAVETCLPSVLLVLVTWLCFLLPPDMVDVRIGISMTTLVTLTSMFTAVRERSPDVNYAMAIDYWMVFCMLLLLIALVLFTYIFWLRRRDMNLQDGKDKNADIENGPDSKADLDQVKLHKSYIRIMGYLRKYAFLLFPVFFLIFLILFLTWILVSSKHLEWEPSPKYNALPLEDGTNTSNRLFALQEDEFKPDTEYKVVESTFRFRDIFKDVIAKNLVKWKERSSVVRDQNVVETTTALAVAHAVNTTDANTNSSLSG